MYLFNYNHKTGKVTERGFDTSDHAFCTEVSTPNKLLQQPSVVSKFNNLKPKKRRILIITKTKTNDINKIVDTVKKKRSYKTITTKEHYKFGSIDFEINSRKSGCYTEILKSMISQTLIMIDMYKRVLFMRFDLYQGGDAPDNKKITMFLKRFRKRLIHRYGNTKFGYLWVREHSKAKQLHYHFIFMIDGDLVRYPSNIHDQVRQVWTDMGGSFHFANHHFIDNEVKLKQAILHGSYLAKVRTKGYRPDQTKDYNASRLKAINRVQT